MSKGVRETIAATIATLVMVTAAWFWTMQIGNVQETLQLMYG